MTLEKTNIIEALRKVLAPTSGKNIMEEKMVGDLKIEGSKVSFSLLMPKLEGMWKAAVHEECVKHIQAKYPNAQVHVHFALASSPLKQIDSSLSQVKHIIAVASGKGGVGKSTVSTNLALALQQMGAKVGLMDADLYGPSIPTMLGLQGQQPKIQDVNGKKHLVPIEAHGLSVISVGFFLQPQQALVVRGPKLAGTITKFCKEVVWSALDYLIIDLPPGTGDVQLTLLKTLSLSGVVVVTTPQEVAVVDVERAIHMFVNPKIQIPILGIVENMSWFTPKELPDHKYLLFGEGGGKQLAAMSESVLLGQIPFVMGIGKAGDEGKPTVLQENTIAKKAFMDIAQKMVEQLKLVLQGKSS